MKEKIISLGKKIFGVIILTVFVTMCIIGGLRSCLIVDNQSVSSNKLTSSDIEKAKEKLTDEEQNKADEIWFKANDILESHMNEEEDIWFEWLLSPPSNDEELKRYIDFSNKIYNRLSKKEKKRFTEIENELKQFLKEAKKQ